jgi:hypothetical protein
MPRENNALSPEEIRAFLTSIEWVALGMLAADGSPEVDLVPAVVESDRLFFAVAPGSAAQANLARDPRCCCSADVFPTYYEIKGATVHGRAVPQEPSERVRATLRARARTHQLTDGLIYSLPLLDDAFGFDFSKIQRR